MGNSGSASRNEQAKSSSQKWERARQLSECEASSTAGQHNGYSKRSSRSKRLAAEATAAAATTAAGGSEETAVGAGAAQRLRQASTWSFGSLSGRLNWSFSGGASKSSFHNRNKASRKSLTSVQQRRSKTQWHKPLTNAIFSTHFKENSRNDHFHIEHLIAKGAFGVVFKVSNKHYQQELQQHTKTKNPIGIFPAPVYALKVLRKSKIIEENSVQQIKDEADIQKLCGHHPFIVQQVDSWQNRRNLHILSEYVPNGELFSKFTQFSTDLIRVYLAEIALAIDFLHNAGVIYRDVKPENILLTEKFHLKLTDFGLSKWLKLGATTKTMCGTFQYMAPEILRGEMYGHAVDWWSMGILVCQMFTQKNPDIKQFLDIALPMPQKDSVDNALQSHVTNNSRSDFVELPSNKKDIALESQSFLPAEVEELPHEAKDVLKRLLAVDAKQRLRSVLALQKIALYKNFTINSKHLLSICPLDIICKDGIAIYDEKPQNGASAAETFQYF